MTTVLRAYKTELDPNNKQRTFFRRCAGVSRKVYNWGLSEYNAWFFDLGVRPISQERLKKYFNCMIKNELYPWMREVPYSIEEAAFRDLGRAIDNYWRQRKDGTVAKRTEQLKQKGRWAKRVAKALDRGWPVMTVEPGYPKFKRRGDPGSFRLKEFTILDDRVEIGRRKDVKEIGAVRLKEAGYIPTNASRYGTYASVSERAGRWFISVLVEEEIDSPDINGHVLGIDLGVHHWAVCSNGKVFNPPTSFRELDRKIARLNKELDRRTSGGSNWHKTKKKLARVHYKKASIRKHFLHQISDYATFKSKPKAIVLEDLNVSGMMQNRHLARAVGEIGFYELRRQIEYKAEWCGIEVVFADRFYPSSKTCSRCGAVRGELALSERIFACDSCGFTIHRDLNAARNLAALVNRETPGDCLGSWAEPVAHCELETRQQLTTV